MDDEEYKQENKQVEGSMKYDEENLSNEDWLNIMQEMKLIHRLLNGRGHLFEIVNDEEYAKTVRETENVENYSI